MKQNTWHVLAKAALETLEDRRMMSASLATISLSGGVLQVTADSSGPAHLTVDFNANHSKVVARSGAVSNSFPAAQVHKIIITGGPEADNIDLDPSMNIPAQITTGDGNDSVRAGGGNDSIVAGNGNDRIKLVTGDNSVVLGSGKDVVDTTRNYDMIVAGSGADFIDGNAGHAVVQNASSKTVVANAAHVSVKHTITAPSTAAAKVATAPVAVANPTATPAGSTGTAGSQSTTPVTPSKPAADAPVVVIKLLAGERQTGLVVNGDGLSSTTGVGDVTAATFVWNFGDAGGDHNVINGFTAGHVYDTPGTYTISLTVTNSAGTATTATQQVTIAAATRNVIYVDGAKGSDKNAGTASAPLQTVDAAMDKLDDNTEILFKAGQSYTVTQTYQIDSSNVLIGSYGSGTDPVLNRAGGNGLSTFTLGNDTNGVTIQHLVFNCPWAAVAENAQAPKIGNSGIYVGGQNNTVRDCTFLNLDDAINENKNPAGTLVEDNNAPLDTGVRGYFVWVQGSEQTIVGNTVVNSTREHCIRMSDWTEVTVFDNTLANLNRQSVDPSDFSKGCIELHQGSYGYVTDNNVTDGDIRTGPLGLWGENTSDTTSDCVIEDNQLTDTFVFVQGGSSDIMISNNVLHSDSSAAIVVAGPNGPFESSNINIINNTAVSNGTEGNFLSMQGAVKGVTLEDNLWIAPKISPGAYGTAAVKVGQTDLSSFTKIEGNVWPTGKNGTGFALGGIMSIDSSTGDGYLTDAQWLAYKNVSDDAFEDVSLTDLSSVYQLNVNGHMVGAAVKLAA